MMLETIDAGQSFECEFNTYVGDTIVDIQNIVLSDISQDIKDVTITLSDKTDFAQ